MPLQLRLPKNSRPRKGKAFPPINGATRTKTLHIYRYDPDSVENRRVRPASSDLREVALERLVRLLCGGFQVLKNFVNHRSCFL